MIIVSCDVCKKKMDNSEYGRNFFFIAHHSICEPCKESLEQQIRPTMRNKDPFATDWYEKLLKDSLDKAVQRGKI
jgi:hypothetical protein